MDVLQAPGRLLAEEDEGSYIHIYGDTGIFYSDDASFRWGLRKLKILAIPIV